MLKLEKILEMCRVNGFIKPIKPATINVKRPDYFHFGPCGELLAQNIQREWVFSNVTAREPSCVFQHYSPGSNDNILRLKDAYDSCKILTDGQLPYGLVEVRSDHNLNQASGSDDYLPIKNHPLRYYAFISHEEGPQFFYRWQQHRHMWWRKFSLDPGRFSLAEIKNGNEMKVEVKANFPWGLVTVETIVNHGPDFFNSLSENERRDFEIMNTRKRCVPYVVESVCTLEAATLTFLCDGFSETVVLGKPKNKLHLHRRLAPFKISFAAAPSSNELHDEIANLASYLSQELRRAGISTLLPQIKRSLNIQLTRCDSLAVPYTLILSSSTLETGLATLRSQQTSLQEEVHVSNIVTYVEQLMKNY